MPVTFPSTDVLLGVVFATIVVNAGRRGFLREAAMLVGLVVGLLLAGRLGPVVATMLWKDAVSGQMQIVAYGVVVVGTLILSLALSTLIRPVLLNPFLLAFDHLAGLAVGVIEAVLLLGFTSTVAGRFGLMAINNTPGSSQLGAFLSTWVSGVLRYLPADFASVERIVGLTKALPIN